MGSHEDEPPPIAPYPFWQSGAPRPQRAPAPPAARRQPAAYEPPSSDQPSSDESGPYDQDEDLATAAYDVMAPDNAPTEAHPVVTTTEPIGLTRRSRRQVPPPPAVPPSSSSSSAGASAGAEAPGAARTRRQIRATSTPPPPIVTDDAVFDQHGEATGDVRIDLTALELQQAEPLPGHRRRAESRRDGGSGFDPRSLTEGVPRSLLVSVGAAVAVLVVCIGVAVLGGGAKDDDAPAADSGKTVAVAPGLTSGTAPADLTPLTPAEAKQALAKAKTTTPGTVIKALGWTDKNGRNAVVTTAESTSDGTTLRVVQVAGLDGKARELRTMRDPNLPSCSSKGSGGSAAFTPDGLAVRDLNKDGIAEVVVGWSSRCAGAGTKSTVRLALLSNGEKYIIRGTGVIGQAGNGNTAPDPASSRWPKGFLSDLTTFYRSLYY